MHSIIHIIRDTSNEYFQLTQFISDSKINQSIEESKTVLEPTLHHQIKTLTGIQKRIFIYILKLCLQNRQLSTGPFTNDQICREIQTSSGNIKTSLTRLEKKLLIKSTSKRARGGYYRFEISAEVKRVGQELLNTE